MIGPPADHLWQSTMLAAAAALLTMAFRRNRAQVRYWLWLSASLKFLVPFALLMSLGSHLGWAPAAKKMATQIAAPAVPLAMVEISQPFPESLAQAPFPPGTRDWAAMAITGVWACGFAGVALMRFRGWLRIRAAVRASTPLDLPATVEVRSAAVESGGLLEPGVVGLFRPILLLPAGIVERLTPLQLQAVLAHELCHVRRRDNLFASIHMIVEAMFWFHPLVWWIGARLVEERERACDEEVLSLGGEPHVYAEGILNVCKLYVESPLVCVSGVTGSNLKKRIEVIMTNRIALRLNFAKKAVLAVAGMAALTVPIAIGIMNAPHIRAQSAAPAIPNFEVVSIQPGCAARGGEARKSNDGTKSGGQGAAPSPGSLNVNCSTVAGLIHTAYAYYANGHSPDAGSPLHYVNAVPMSGGPPWIYTDNYQIDAKAVGTPGQEMMRGPMMRALLEDRFKLKVRRETREVPAYMLTVAEGGPKLQPYRGNCSDTLPPAPLAPGQKYCWQIEGGERKESNFTPHFGIDTHVKDLDGLSIWLYGMTDRPVLNKTGIAGKFFMNLEFAPDESTPGALARLAVVARHNGGNPSGAAAAPSNPPGPSISNALEQQLGLKLEPATGSRDFLVIDHAERPAVN